VRGEDRFRWLSGMVTNDVNDLGANTGSWNLVLNAQGRIQGDVTVWREPKPRPDSAGSEEIPDRLELMIAADQYERLVAHLEKFIIMDDVELAPLDGRTALGLTGPKAGEVLGRLGLPTLNEANSQLRCEWNGMNLRIRRGFGVTAEHYELWTPVALVAKLWKFLLAGGATRVGSAAVEAFRIAEGIPAYGSDILERDLPQETSQMRALSFTKGCYLGQEIVERIRSRGSVHKHLRHVELDGPLPAPGAELKLDGADAGRITSAAELELPAGVRRFALAMMRAEAEARGEAFTYAAGGSGCSARLLAGKPIF
jgi:folate-binding protein YgfZ